MNYGLTTYSKTVPLHTSPHYTDARFKEPQTVFGKPASSMFGHRHLKYVYSDKLWQWDYDKADTSVKTANESGAPLKSCQWYEAYLSAYYDKKVVIEHILAGVNVSNSYPYCVFGFQFIEDGEEQ